MTEYTIYGKDGLFHNVTKASTVMNGRYAVLAKGATDLNRNNVISELDLPKNGIYPGVFCLPPVSEFPSTTVQHAAWETFSFALLFLCTTYATGDNKIKSPDPSTNSSLHKADMDWSDMKHIALGFMQALERVVLPGFRMGQTGTWRIRRVTETQNARLSGVLLSFTAAIVADCNFTDINIDGISITIPNHLH